MKNAASSYITVSNMELFSFTNISKIKDTPKGIVMAFHGKGFTGTMSHNPFTDRLAAMGVVYITPYYGPWAWMNSSALALSDALRECVQKHYGITDTLPCVSTGSSMGGINSLLYCIFAERPVMAAALDSPVAEQVNHYNIDYYMAKTILPCFAEEEWQGEVSDFWAKYCPVCLADRMPYIPYLFVHGIADSDTSKKLNSDIMVQALRERNHNVEYLEVPGMEHCAFPPHIAEYFYNWIAERFGTPQK